MSDGQCTPVRAPAEGHGTVRDGLWFECDDGYHGDNLATDAEEYTACEPNQCSCSLDEAVARAALAEECTVHGDDVCVCLPGRQGTFCDLTSPCFCQNGVEHTGVQCNASLSSLHQCKECDLGYYLSAGLCMQVQAPSW